MRLRWSLIATGVPGGQSGLSPPAAFVSTIVEQPARIADLTPWTTSLSVRPHDIRLSAAPISGVENVVPGKVIRQVFLGGHRDYVVETAGGTPLRVVAPAEQNIAPETAVWLHLPPERCHALIG